MVRWLRWHCPPDTGFEIRALAVWGRARYLSVTEAPRNTDFHTWMGKKHFCFFQTAESGNRTPNSGVKGSGANHYPRAPAPSPQPRRGNMSCEVLYIADLFCLHGNIRPGNITISLFFRALILFFDFFVFLVQISRLWASYELNFQNWQNWKCLIPRGPFKSHLFDLAFQP